MCTVTCKLVHDTNQDKERGVEEADRHVLYLCMRCAGLVLSVQYRVRLGEESNLEISTRHLIPHDDIKLKKEGGTDMIPLNMHPH